MGVLVAERFLIDSNLLGQVLQIQPTILWPCRLEVADLNLRIHRTVETNIPGQRFSVRVSATRLNGTSISTDAAVRLLDLGDWRAVARISDTPSKITPESNCTVSTGDISLAITGFSI